jgi:FdhE protein
VAGGILDKLFGSRPALPTDVSEAVTELNRLVDKRPALAELAGELNDLLPLLYAEPVHEASPTIDADKGGDKLASGVPLLRDEPVAIDVPSFVRRAQRLTKILQRRRPDAASVQKALSNGKLDPAWLIAEILTGRTRAFYERAEELGLDVPLTATVVWLTLFPVMCHLRTALAPLRREMGWRQGFCPTCGAWPKLGEFRGLEQTRFLRCSLCADEWEFPRLRCPFCGNSEHQQLGYLHVEGEESQHRAATCEGCRHYVKMQATLSAFSAPQLLVADLATMHLDLAAAERSYTQPL